MAHLHLDFPSDQEIVDTFFGMDANPKSKKIAWIYGMVSTYGIKPDELYSLQWGLERTITIKRLKRPIKPVHPEWPFLFGLKEKQPFDSKDCLDEMITEYYEALSLGRIELDIHDLLFAHKIRKQNCKFTKDGDSRFFSRRKRCLKSPGQQNLQSKDLASSSAS
jgi:hypothetical protein